MQRNAMSEDKIRKAIFTAYARIDKDVSTTPKVRQVNVVPISKVKKAVIEDDDDEESVACGICKKVYVSEMAVLNHARVEHIDEYMRGEQLCVKSAGYDKKKRKLAELDEGKVRRKTEELMSSMEPTDMTRLASKDVSYIIIKNEQTDVKKLKKDKVKVEKPAKIVKSTLKKEKEVKTIMNIGPIECLQPSTHNSEGLCHQIFLSCCQYSTHCRDEHTRRRKAARCQVCEKPLVEADQSAPHSCQVCGMGFQTTCELLEHTNAAHVKLKPYQCTVCQKRFTQQAGLMQHMRGHTGDRPFTCIHCPKAFTQKSGLDQHLRIHTKVKPYKCIICSKSFCQSVHLQQHMRTHTNVTPFQCNICQKRFKQSSHLNYHLRYHNPENMTEDQKVKYAQLVQLVGKEETVEVQVDTSHTEFLLQQVEGDQVTEFIVGDNHWEDVQTE